MEEELCREMTQVYKLYMRDKDEGAFIQKYRERKGPVGFSFAIDLRKKMVVAGFSCENEITDVVTSFPVNLARKDRVNLEKECVVVGIIVTEVLDRIYDTKVQPQMKIGASLDFGSGLAKEIWKVVNTEK